MYYLNKNRNTIALMFGISLFCFIQNAKASNISQTKQSMEELENRDLSIRSNSAQEAQYLATKGENELNDQKDTLKVKHKHVLLINMSKLMLKKAYEEKLDIIKENNRDLFSFYYTSTQMKEFKRMTPEEINLHFSSYAQIYYGISGFSYYSDYLVPPYKAEKEKLIQYAYVMKNIKSPGKEEVVQDAISSFGFSYELAEAAYIKSIQENTN